MRKLIIILFIFLCSHPYSLAFGLKKEAMLIGIPYIENESVRNQYNYLKETHGVIKGLFENIADPFFDEVTIKFYSNDEKYKYEHMNFKFAKNATVDSSANSTKYKYILDGIEKKLKSMKNGEYYLFLYIRSHIRGDKILPLDTDQNYLYTISIYDLAKSIGNICESKNIRCLLIVDGCFFRKEGMGKGFPIPLSSLRDVFYPLVTTDTGYIDENTFYKKTLQIVESWPGSQIKLKEFVKEANLFFITKKDIEISDNFPFIDMNPYIYIKKSAELKKGVKVKLSLSQDEGFKEYIKDNNGKDIKEYVLKDFLKCYKEDIGDVIHANKRQRIYIKATFHGARGGPYPPREDYIDFPEDGKRLYVIKKPKKPRSDIVESPRPKTHLYLSNEFNFYKDVKVKVKYNNIEIKSLPAKIEYIKNKNTIEIVPYDWDDAIKPFMRDISIKEKYEGTERKLDKNKITSGKTYPVLITREDLTVKGYPVFEINNKDYDEQLKEVLNALGFIVMEIDEHNSEIREGRVIRYSALKNSLKVFISKDPSPLPEPPQETKGVTKKPSKSSQPPSIAKKHPGGNLPFIYLIPYNVNKSPDDNRNMIIVAEKKAIKGIQLKGKEAKVMWTLSTQDFSEHDIDFKGHARVYYNKYSKYFYLTDRRRTKIHILNKGTGKLEMRLEISNCMMNLKKFHFYEHREFSNEEPTIFLAFSTLERQNIFSICIINRTLQPTSRDPILLDEAVKITTPPAISDNGTVYFGCKLGSENYLMKLQNGNLEPSEVDGEIKRWPFIFRDREKDVERILVLTQEGNSVCLLSSIVEGPISLQRLDAISAIANRPPFPFEDGRGNYYFGLLSLSAENDGFFPLVYDVKEMNSYLDEDREMNFFKIDPKTAPFFRLAADVNYLYLSYASGKTISFHKKLRTRIDVNSWEDMLSKEPIDVGELAGVENFKVDDNTYFIWSTTRKKYYIYVKDSRGRFKKIYDSTKTVIK